MIANSKNKEVQFLKIKSSKAPEHLQIFNLTFIYRSLDLCELIPQDVLKRENSEHFTIIEVLEIFRYLVVISLSMQDQRKLKSIRKNIQGWIGLFAPVMNKTNLIKSLADITNKPYGLILKIINFLTFDIKKDLWCHPILELKKNKVTLLNAAFADAVIERLVEQWLKQFGLSFDEKGFLFEITVKSGVKSSLNKSSIINDFNVAEINEFKVEDKKEQIDLLIRIGKMVLVGEIKSKITTDSYVSHYSFLETIKKGTTQVNRKCVFVENHLSQIFNKLKWPFCKNDNYEVFPVIITNNFAGIGSSLFGVPIIDSKILEYYLCNTTFRIFSMQTESKLTDMIWLSLYNSQEEAEKNLIKYLKKPPQLHNPTLNFRENIYQYPCLTNNEFIVRYTAIITESSKVTLTNKIELVRLMENSYEFPINVNPEFLK